MEFLSTEWIAAMDDAARRVPGDAIAGVTVTVEHVVDAVTWHLAVADGTVRILAGPADDPDVRFRSALDVARSIASGERAATDAFMAGELQIGGRLDVLMEHHRGLAAIEDAFAPVRAATFG